MNLKVKPFHKNTFPLHGILIKNKTVKHWLFQLQALQIDLLTSPVFAIPDTTPNSVWGCFIALEQSISIDYQTQNVQFCQSIQNKLFIPEYSVLSPKLNCAEIDKLFAKNPHIFHPEFGLFELENPIVWEELLEMNKASSFRITTPAIKSFCPQYIRKIEVKALSPDEMLKSVEDKIFPKKESFEDEPLNWTEKIKYNLLKLLYKTTKAENGDSQIETASWLQNLESFLKRTLPNSKKVIGELESDFRDLEKRNSSEMEKLMNLFKKNPEEALKYAIPIDNEGTNRGGNKGTFTMSRRWKSFNLFGNYSMGTGNTLIQDDSMYKLQQQYNQSATNFIKEKDYEKAAFIYLKLLKNNQMAANSLEDGKLYPEAAAVYLKYLNNKEKAASCYEKARMTSDAIHLYKELNMNEKVGDLYISINNQKEANQHYNYVLENYKATCQYVKAALLLKNKMNDGNTAQEMLLNGWREQKDSFNCLSNYFENIGDLKILSREIDKIYVNHIDENNKAEFLKVLKNEHKRDPLLAIQTKGIAYEIVSHLATENPNILNELPAFNKDTQLTRDISRYKNRKNLLLLRNIYAK